MFPFDRIPARFRDIVGLNPIAQIVEDLRHSLVDARIPSMEAFIGPLVIVPILLSVAVLIIGFAVFTWLTPSFAESL